MNQILRFLLVVVLASPFAAAGSRSQLPFEPKELTRAEQALIEKAPLGSMENPVRCFMPEGEIRYLERLICANGTPPRFKRMGSYGEGPHGTILDGFEVKCKKPKLKAMVFLDMYHEGYVEARAIPGFEIAPEGRQR